MTPMPLGGRGRAYDLTIYGIIKFFNLAMHNNPNIIDSLFTPVNCVLHSTRVGDIVRENRKLFLHKGAWSKFKEQPPRVKPLLYVYRVLLTGIHLMRTGQVEANLVCLNEDALLSHVADLIARKLAGPEGTVVGDGDMDFHRCEYDRLQRVLEQAHSASSLPEAPTARPALNDLLLRLRMQTIDGATP